MSKDISLIHRILEKCAGTSTPLTNPEIDGYPARIPVQLIGWLSRRGVLEAETESRAVHWVPETVHVYGLTDRGDELLTLLNEGLNEGQEVNQIPDDYPWLVRAGLADDVQRYLGGGSMLDLAFAVECPGCGHEVTQSLRRLQRDSPIRCAICEIEFRVNVESVARSIEEIEQRLQRIRHLLDRS